MDEERSHADAAFADGVERNASGIAGNLGAVALQAPGVAVAVDQQQGAIRKLHDDFGCGVHAGQDASSGDQLVVSAEWPRSIWCW